MKETNDNAVPSRLSGTEQTTQTQTNATGTKRTYPQLVKGDAPLSVVLGVDSSTVRTWRKSRLIPYTKTGHRTIVYSLEKVLAALERFEVKTVTEPKGGR